MFAILSARSSSARLASAYRFPRERLVISRAIHNLGKVNRPRRDLDLRVRDLKPSATLAINERSHALEQQVGLLCSYAQCVSLFYCYSPCMLLTSPSHTQQYSFKPQTIYILLGQ